MLFVLNFFLYVSAVLCSDLFHVRSNITFYPDDVADYFGYSVLLSPMGLHVGAPKARSRTNTAIAPGLVFKCPLNLTHNINLCDSIDKNWRSRVMPNDFFKDDMWFGATMAAVPNGKLLVCAPRITRDFQNHRLADGACYMRSNITETVIYPIRDRTRLALLTDGKRPEYGEYGTHLNYYAYGQAGMAVKVTDNNHVIIGAPGVLQWTGLVTQYTFSPSTFRLTRGRWTNPYYTQSLGPDDYFGYSVESGVFEKNGETLYIGGAPRSKRGYGQVILYDPKTINESEALRIKAQLEGPQLGSYFGASLCAVDIDGDGFSDLLVGSPNFVKRGAVLTYDQGAVFVYMNRQTDNGFRLSLSGSVRGSGASGARFGSSIAELGDVNSDKYKDVAIGAPWEDDGRGVVYIYEGYEYGLKNQYSQRLQAEGARGFGISISKGYDVDNNKCNDLAIGAHNSGTAHLYRGVPTIRVMSMIKVPDARNLKLSADNFTTMFCVTVPPSHSAPDAQLQLKATVLIDPERNRARSMSETEYVVIAKSGLDICDEQIIQVDSAADFSKPISIKFDLEPVTDIDKLNYFPSSMARLSEDSTLHSSFLIQLLSDCGDDLVCTPWLEVSLEPFNSQYVPGESSKLGAKVKVINKLEPAYSVKLHVSLPCGLKRLPSSCSLDNLDLTCDLPAPLKRNQVAEWDIELEYHWEGRDDELKLIAVIEDPVYSRNISGEAKELTIPIAPRSDYTVNGRTEPNRTITITREAFENKENIMIQHFYEITNRGPSDLYHVDVTATVPEEVTLFTSADGSILDGKQLKFGISAVQANVKSSFVLSLRFNYEFAEKLDQELTLNITSKALFFVKNYYKSIGSNITQVITTTLILEAKTHLWLFLIISLVVGIAVLAIIILILYKCGFFSRTKKEELKQLLENNSAVDDASCSLSQSRATALAGDAGSMDCDFE